ncbi:MAG: hypothetical protein K5889_00280 [Lachnospiraceae bacterium]|nr:hypothetical protein [Lachnospiraceae bacterium]
MLDEIMSSEAIENIRITSVVLGGAALLGVMYTLLPVGMCKLQGQSVSKYAAEITMGEVTLLIFALCVIFYLITSWILQKRHSAEYMSIGSGLCMVASFLLQTGEWGGKQPKNPRTREEIRKSSLLHHFSKKVNVLPILWTTMITPIFLLAVLAAFLGITTGNAAGINLFQRNGRAEADAGNMVYIFLICLILLLFELSAIRRIRVKTNNLEADIEESKIPLEVLDREFQRSQCIGHDIWIGEEHIFLSGGQISYMFAKDWILDIEQETIIGNIRMLFLPYYLLTVTSLTGEQANIISFDSHIKEKLVEAIGWKKDIE